MDSHGGNFLEGGNGFDDVRGDAARPASIDPADLAGLIDHLPGIVYRCDATEPWEIRYVSPQAKALTGYPAAEFISGARKWRDLVHPDDVARSEARRGTELTENGACVLEYRIRRRDGEIFWVVEHSKVVRMRNGQLALEGYVYDNSDQKKIGPGLKGLSKRGTFSVNGAKITDESLKAWIENGDQLMPPFKETLEPGQIKDVIAYVKTL